MLRQIAAAFLATAALIAASDARAAATDCFGDTIDGVSSIADSVGCVEFSAGEGEFFVRNWFHVGDPETSQLFEEMFVLDIDGERMDVGSLDLIDSGEGDGTMNFTYQLVRDSFILTIGLNFALGNFTIDPDPPISFLTETINMLLETDGDPIDVSLFAYTDFDLGGDGDGDAIIPIPVDALLQGDLAAGALGALLFDTDTPFGFGTSPNGLEVRECGVPVLGECELIDAIFAGTNNADGGIIDGEGDLTHAVRYDIGFLEDGSAEVTIVKALQVDAPTAVPEPATLALAGLGLAGFGWLRRRAA